MLSKKVKQIISTERSRFAEKEIERKKQLEAMIEETTQRGIVFNRTILPNLRRARKDDYEKWLNGYVLNGGKISHFYDYPFGQAGEHFYVATNNFTLIPMFGANSVSIIIPNGIKVTDENKVGHSTLFFMDKFLLIGSFVPCYSDI